MFFKNNTSSVYHEKGPTFSCPLFSCDSFILIDLCDYFIRVIHACFSSTGTKCHCCGANEVSLGNGLNCDDVIIWKHFPRYWPFVRGIHRSPVNFPHKGQWRGALMFSVICVWINGWVNNREDGDLRRHSAHYDVIIMILIDLCEYFTHIIHGCFTSTGRSCYCCGANEGSLRDGLNHDDVIIWKYFPHYWPFVRGIHPSPVNSPHYDVSVMSLAQHSKEHIASFFLGMQY